MNDTIAGRLVRPVGRLLFEVLTWLPVWLLLTIGWSAGGRTAWLAAAAGCWIVGVLFAQLRPPWRLLTVLLATLALVAAAIAVDYREYLVFGIWLAVLAWRGRYVAATPSQYGLAFLIAAACVIAAPNVDGGASYRTAFIVLAIIWVAGTLIALNRTSVHDAGLRSTMVTRGVLRDSRKYALAFIAFVLILFGLTVSYGEQWLKPPRINLESSPPPESPEEIAPPPTQQGLPFPMEAGGEPSLFWDILSWIVGVFAAFAFAWFAYVLWRDRTWSWRAWKDALRRLFMRDRKEETLPYVEERRSLPKTKRQMPWSELFHRSRRGPEWNKLNEAQKVRRLYTEAVTAAVAEGYAHEAHRTPAETLDAMERWQANRAGGASGRHSAYWSWFAGIRQSLQRLYERARYSPYEVRRQDVDGLMESHPEREKR